MWLLLKAFAVRFVVGRTVGGLLTTLLLTLVPAAGALTLLGVPLLAVLGTIGLPLVLLLGSVGMPVLIALGIGLMVLAAVAALLALGVFAIKIVLPIVLTIWFVRWIFRTRPAEPLT